MSTRTLASAVAVIVTAAAFAFPGLAHAQTDRVAGLYRDSYVLEAKGDYAGAASKVRDAKQASPRSYFAAARLGWLTYLAGDFSSSVAAYTEAIGLEPKAVEPKLGLTLPLVAAKKWRDLERACRDVLAVDAQNATALSRLAQAQYWSDNFADAAATYRRLADNYPSNLDYKTGLGWALLKTGRAADAKQQFDAVLAVSPDNASAKQGLAGR